MKHNTKLAVQLSTTTSTRSHTTALTRTRVTTLNTRQRTELFPQRRNKVQPSTNPTTTATCQRNAYQTPRTSSTEPHVYVLTLITDEHVQETLTALRKKYFPSHLNHIPAHITLFHALPHTHLECTIIPHLTTITNSTTPFPLATGAPFRLRKGIAIPLLPESGGHQVVALRERLRVPWAEEGWLSKQDMQRSADGGEGAKGAKWRAHWTIMNKVEDEAVVTMALEEVLGWRGEGWARGVRLWRYGRGGRWGWEGDWWFEGAGEERRVEMSEWDKVMSG